MRFDPAVFGKGFHAFVQAEYELFGNLSPFFHIISLAVLFLIFKSGNRHRRAFVIYFTLNWVFLFGYWGVYGVCYWFNTGIVYLAVYSIAPLLLLLIVLTWMREIKKPVTDFDLKNVPKSKFAVLIILVWGLWYPSYIYGQGFSFQLKDMMFSYYGLMPCPTTMFVLSIMTLKYPAGNKRLFRLFTAYALFIGTATAASGWLPDIPFITLGIYAACLILHEKRKKRFRTEGLQ